MILAMQNQRLGGDYGDMSPSTLRPLRVQAVIDHLTQALAKASWAGT
ncbi:hypothetical protein [Sphingomonas sanguinis]|nr:hypothetical protein [Sphingomonas sanguinis]